MKIQSKDRTLFNVAGYSLISILAALTVIPFIIIISSSLTTESAIISKGYTIIPLDFSISAYSTIFGYPESIIKAYGMTLYTTGVGTILGLFLSSMAAYVLWRKDFKWRNGFTFFFYFTTLFGGGLVPWYILCVQYLHFKELPFAALVAPYLFSVFNILIIRNFMKSIPDALTESAKIDGAGDFRIFIQLVFPLSKPALATIGLFIALGYWNDWYLAFMFINKQEFYTLQYYLFKTISAQQALTEIANKLGKDLGVMPMESAKMAMTVIATGPIILLYPFLQKYFVKGLTIGAVKG